MPAHRHDRRLRRQGPAKQAGHRTAAVRRRRRLAARCAEGQPRRHDGRGAARTLEDGGLAGEGRRCRAGILWRRSRRRSASPYRMARRSAADACRRRIGSMFMPASIPRFRWIGRAKRRCCGSAIRRDFPGGFGDLHVVHGHDNYPDGPLLYEGRTNLDTLAWRTGRLTIGVFDDDRPGGPVDFIVVRGPPAGVATGCCDAPTSHVAASRAFRARPALQQTRL